MGPRSEKLPSGWPASPNRHCLKIMVVESFRGKSCPLSYISKTVLNARGGTLGISGWGCAAAGTAQREGLGGL